MDDETLTPFVDALSASLIIMILVAISFILQNITSIRDVAKQHVVDSKVEEEDGSPIKFNDPLSVDHENNEILFILNFKLADNDIKIIREELMSYERVKITIGGKQSERKMTANLIRFLAMMQLPRESNVETTIVPSRSTVSKLSWSN